MESSPGGIGKLNPMSIAAKRRRRKEGSIAETTGSSNSTDEATPEKTPRGRLATPRYQDAPGAQDQEAGQKVPRADSGPTDSPGDEEDNSLISYDSEPELPSRPTAISTHPSQIGYLTTSSPLVQAAHHPDSQASDSQFSQPSQEGSTTLDISVDTLDSQTNPTSLNTQASSTLTPAPTLSRPSSIGRLRGVFRSKRGSAGSASPSPERRPQTSGLDRSSEPPEPAWPPPTGVPVADSKPDPAQTTPNVPVKVAASDRLRRLSRGQKIDTSNPPRTPPNGEKATPVIVNTPPTPTDHENSSARSLPSDTPAGSPNASTQGTMVGQRRGRAGSGTIVPSKLSNITPAPLTPTPELDASTPGTNTPSNFFSSMISAVQSTANTLSNTITNTSLPGGHKQKGSIATKELGDIAEDTSVEVESSTEALGEQLDSKEPAVKTLGMGDLSLSQLGIVESGSAAPTPVAAKFSDSETRARSESAPVENSAGTMDATSDDSHGGGGNKPVSLYEHSNGPSTPPPGSVYEGKAGIQRSSSIRSAIGRRRKRGSSAATGGTGAMTIGAAIAAANASVAHPNAQSSTPKLTGFAVANKKRNRDFHTLFKSVPDDDYLIEDYSCALQREILAHGRLYISEGHLCFSSNIFGWVTTLVMSFDEIVSVEKRSTALVFKNGLEISTLHAKHIFASFASRDTTYDLIVKIWKLGHPHLKSSLNGVRLDETGGDRTEKIETESISVGGSQSASVSEDESDEGDIYDEDEDDLDGADNTQLTDMMAVDALAERPVTRKPSGAVAVNSVAEKADEGAAPSSSPDFPGPASHAPTDCGDGGSHYEKFMGEDIVQAPLGKVYSLLFGPASVTYMSKWLTVDQKCTELQMEDKRGLTEDNKSRTYSYIKPLPGSIGPRQTKCITTEEVLGYDLEKAVNILCSTQTPDVPSGNIFSVKTKYCFSWAENNSTRIQANCTIEWTGKSWLKGPIEKGANEGQVQYFKELMASAKAALSSKPKSTAMVNGATKGHKKRKKGKSAQASNPASDGEGISKASPKNSWGLLEPAHPFLGPVVDIVKPLITGNVVYGLLVGLLVAAWFGFGTTRQTARPYGSELGYLAYPHRIAAYEEMWRREESELWEWLEERLSMDRVHAAAAPPPPRKKVTDPRSVEEKIREDRMDEREIREAIRVTEEHLEVLKSVINKQNPKKG